MRTLTVRINDSQYEFLQRQAAATYGKVGQIIRQAIACAQRAAEVQEKASERKATPKKRRVQPTPCGR